MKKINIDYNAPLLYKLKTFQDSFNELLNILQKQGIVELEVEKDEQ